MARGKPGKKKLVRGLQHPLTKSEKVSGAVRRPALHPLPVFTTSSGFSKCQGKGASSAHRVKPTCTDIRTGGGGICPREWAWRWKFRGEWLRQWVTSGRWVQWWYEFIFLAFFSLFISQSSFYSSGTWKSEADEDLCMGECVHLKFAFECSSWPLHRTIWAIMRITPVQLHLDMGPHLEGGQAMHIHLPSAVISL